MKFKMHRLFFSLAVLLSAKLISSFSIQIGLQRKTKSLTRIINNETFKVTAPRQSSILSSTLSTSYLTSHGQSSFGFNSNHDRERRMKRKQAPNNRVAIRWVVEAIEKILNNESAEGFKGGKAFTVNKIDDNAILLDCLYRMAHAKSKQDAREAEGFLLSLEIEKKYSYAIQERILKAVSMAGYMKLSLRILDSMISVGKYDHSKQDEIHFSDVSSVYLPSSMSYISVLNRLRKWKKVDTMREILVKLSCASKLQGESLHIVAFNTYLAALCEEAEKYDHRELLDEAVHLLHPHVAMEQYNFPDPDVLSFNTVLHAVAALKNDTILHDTISIMKKQGIAPDIATYNAMLKSAKSHLEKLEILDEIYNSPSLSLDKYTIDMMLIPLAERGLIADLMKLLQQFVMANQKNEVANAFSAFLLTLVKGGEIDFARAVFDTFILSPTILPNVEGDNGVGEVVQVKALTRHFNAMFEGYKILDDPYKWSRDTNSELSPVEHCCVTLDQMKTMNVAPDAYSLTLLMSVQKDSDQITWLWNEVMGRIRMEVGCPMYHSIITAYGRVGDIASACHVFDNMITSGNLQSNLKSWNVLLSAISKCAKYPDSIIDYDTCNGKVLDLDNSLINESPFDGKYFRDLVIGLTPYQAAMTILGIMKKSKVYGGESSDFVLIPNSQSYCLVASSLANSIETDADAIMELFNAYLENGFPIDGRFLNALIRCYGEDIAKALQSWKTVFRPALLRASPKITDSSPNILMKSRLGKNVIAAYHGLLFVAGKSYRPDIALRIAYAMSREGVEPLEASMNAYNAGTRLRRLDKEKVRLHGQYENLLLVECTKYDSNDKRRMSEKRVRIII